MKKLVTVTEVEGEGLEALLGEKVLLFCLNYIYTGKLIGVNASCVQFEDLRLCTKPDHSPIKHIKTRRNYTQMFGMSSLVLLNPLESRSEAVN